MKGGLVALSRAGAQQAAILLGAYWTTLYPDSYQVPLVGLQLRTVAYS